MLGRGKGPAEDQRLATENHLKAHVTQVHATTRFASSAFFQFESIYASYEALAKSFTKMRETDDQQEEMKYLIGLGGHIDVMYRPMEMMFKDQSLDQYLWSITKWWAKVKAMLLTMQSMIEEQLNEVDVVLPQELFPKLHEHYEDLMKRDPTECTFKKIELYPGWMVSNETEAVDGASRKKKKVIK
eukprot:Seg2562.2 transcript_id=Seg2562.2/GoldUCD/mRNA.D3Y31 product="hypothetical protein" protein_id=Seg2562.2/GoldUCD/D3Y31